MADKFTSLEVYLDLYSLIISKNLAFSKFAIILSTLPIPINGRCIDTSRGITCFDPVIRDNGGFYH